MAYQYRIAYGLTNSITESNWTTFDTTSNTSDTVTGLASGTNYFFRIITVDTVTGITSSPVIVGPFPTNSTQTESPDGTTVTSPVQTIRSSTTPGVAAPSGPFDIWTITSVGGQVIHNTVTDPNTSAVLELYYINHFVYQQASNGNTFGTPGWWQWNPSSPSAFNGYVEVQDPRPASPTISINPIASQATNTAFSVSGVMLNYTTAPTLQYVDGNGVLFQPLPTGSTVSNTAFNFIHPGLSAQTTTVTVRDQNTTTISSKSNSFVVSAPTITGITLSTTSLTSFTVANTAVATITVNFTGGVFAGTVAIQNQVPAGSFTVGGTANPFNLVTATQISGTAGTQYNFNLVASQSGLTSFTQPETMTVAQGGVGPVATGTLITADFTTSIGGLPMSSTLFGIAMGHDADFSPWGNTGHQNAAKNLAGFADPGMFIRINPQNECWGGYVPNLTQFGVAIAALPNIVNINTCQIAVNLGPGDGSSSPLVNGDININHTTFGTQCVQVVQLFENAGINVKIWEIGNEWNGSMSNATYFSVFNAASSAILAHNSNYLIAGGCFSFETAMNWANFIANCGTNIGVFDYHNYPALSGGGTSPTSSQSAADFQTALTYWRNTGTDLVNNTSGSTKPRFCGEYDLHDTTPGDSRKPTIYGAVWNVLSMVTLWLADQRVQYGSIWDWLGDAYYGIIIDPNNNPAGLPGDSVIPCGYAYRFMRSKFCFGSTGTIYPASKPSGNIQVLSSVNGVNCAVCVINYDTSNSFSGTIGFSRWPFNNTGTATLNTYRVSQTNLTTLTGTVSATAGVTSSMSFPALSVTVISTV